MSKHIGNFESVNAFKAALYNGTLVNPYLVKYSNGFQSAYLINPETAPYAYFSGGTSSLTTNATSIKIQVKADKTTFSVTGGWFSISTEPEGEETVTVSIGETTSARSCTITCNQYYMDLVTSQYVLGRTVVLNLTQNANAQPSNEIWYTTQDNEPVAITTGIGNYGGPTVVSNVYDSANQRCVMTFDDAVTKVGQNLFTYYPNFSKSDGSGKLTSLSLPNSVTTIYGNDNDIALIYGNLTLQDIKLGNAVTNIGFYAFRKGGLPIKLTINTETPPTFGGFGDEFYSWIKVPAQAVDIYRATQPWSDKAFNILPIE